MMLLALSLFLTEPAPLEMPRADAFLVREDGVSRLEDRYNRTDLWISQTVVGRWVDGEDRTFVLSRLLTCPPAGETDVTVTRRAAVAERVPIKRVRANADFPQEFKSAIALLSSCPLAEKPRPPRQLPHGFKHVYYWQSPTNLSDIVCTFLPERTDTWYLATWRLAVGDDFPARLTAFEDEFLRHEFVDFVAAHPHEPVAPSAGERDLLRADARHAVAAYDNWHFAGAAEIAVVDDLPARDFVVSLTNDLPVMRAKYAAAMPTPLDGSNVLSVARLYASRDEYLDALETDGLTNMTWSAAYWSPQRRELVAYLPERGEAELLKTIRHEAFHQYLSYATSMIAVSPWLNEGYAQYFEQGVDDPLVDSADLPSLAELVIPLLAMDYEDFYSGTDRERALKYRLALATVYFLEKGAPKVRFDPFKDLKRDYVRNLLETHDMRKATVAAFGNRDRLNLFVSEWTKFWTDR